MKDLISLTNNVNSYLDIIDINKFKYNLYITLETYHLINIIFNHRNYLFILNDDNDIIFNTFSQDIDFINKKILRLTHSSSKNNILVLNAYYPEQILIL